MWIIITFHWYLCLSYQKHLIISLKADEPEVSLSYIFKKESWAFQYLISDDLQETGKAFQCMKLCLELYSDSQANVLFT